MRKNIITSLLTFVVAASTCLLTACTQPAKPEVDVGERTSKISWIDGEKHERLTISTTDVAKGSLTAPVEAIRTYGHDISDATQIYRITTPTKHDADYVASQGAYMIWVDGVLFRFRNSQSIEKLSKRPEVTLDKLPANTAISSFYEVDANRTFNVGPTSFDGTVPVVVSRLFTRQMKYVTEFLNVSTRSTAAEVSSLDGWVFSIGDQWYHVTTNRTVDPLPRKPQYDLGILEGRISGKDEEDKSLRKVTATGWSLDRKHIIVRVEQHYVHYMPLEDEIYEVRTEPHANYNSLDKSWVVEIDGERITLDDVPEESKPEQTKPDQPDQWVDVGLLNEKIDQNDPENKELRLVTPLKLDNDGTYGVLVARHYVNDAQKKRYYIQKERPAVYKQSYKGYVLKVGKDTYVISLTGKVRKL
jgi:hypothetical protein